MDENNLIDTEQAFAYIVQTQNTASSPLFRNIGPSNYGYDIYLPHVVENFVSTQNTDSDPYKREQLRKKTSPLFYDAAWEMCRRGILRPGIKEWNAQDTGKVNDGYSFTDKGKAWLAESGQYDLVPTETGRFARTLDAYSERFGDGFRQRSQEAIRCYDSHSYFGCCVLCGAAAESILMALSSTKLKDSEDAIKQYDKADGKKKMEDLLLHDKKQNLKDAVKGCTTLIAYWRNAAAHASNTIVDEKDAWLALAILLRFSQMADKEWDTLIA